MRGLSTRFACGFLGVLATCLSSAPSTARGQSTLSASSLALRSSGSGAGGSWTLANNGYVGTYLTLSEPGAVTVSVNAAGVGAAGVDPRMNLVVAGTSVGFDVPAGTGAYQHTFNLPAGTHLVRAEMSNDAEKSARALAIDDLTVSAGSFSNSNVNANAIAAADTYIENYRKGDARLQLFGATPGAEVQVALKRHAFNFGTAVSGTSNNVGSSLMAPNPAPGTTAARYQQFIKDHFTMLVPENGGKWNVTEGMRDSPSMALSDAMVNFANANGMRFRQHALVWGSNGSNPGWANTLMANAAAGSDTAKADLLDEINERIAYYVGNGVAAGRTNDYLELDVLNEGIHEPELMTAYGASGMASIFNSVSAAVDAAGASTKLMINEYNVLQFSAGNDSYANWFREHGESIIAAGGRMDGYGVQYYAILNGSGNNAHSPARIAQVMTNLSNGGKTVALTEFGVQNNLGGGTPSQSAVADVLEDSMRIVFGTPNASGFTMWGFRQGLMWNQAPHAALADTNYNLTIPGQRYEELMDEWNTELTLPVDEAGGIDFRGFYGVYDVTIGGQTFTLDLTNGTTDYSLVVGTTADLNHDGHVDGADLLAWQVALSDEPGEIGRPGDGNFDGFVNVADLDLWTAAVTASATAATAGVPEPGALAILLTALTALVRRRLVPAPLVCQAKCATGDTPVAP